MKFYSRIRQQFEVGRYQLSMQLYQRYSKPLPTTKMVVMSLRHKTYDVRGVQFHPESVLTLQVKKMLENW
jgi:anthranilate synthase component 2